MSLITFSYTVNTMPPLICEVHLCQPENKEEEEGRGSATDHKPREPGRRARPEAQEALLGEDPVRAVERVPVRLPRLQALHARLDHAIHVQFKAIKCPLALQ